MKISEIRVYPIKSLGGISLRSAEYDRRGFKLDRRWMLVDAKGKFLTQREFPEMAVFQVSVQKRGLKVTAPGGDSLVVPFEADGARSIGVSVWGSSCRGDLYGNTVEEFFSDSLGRSARLVKISDSRSRRISRYYAVHPGDEVGFADGYPFLIAGTASLDQLNSWMRSPVPMDRFRPNLIVTGSEAFAEDSWRRIRIGASEFHVVKPCSRCVMITVDQSSGKKSGSEPLSVLGRHRTYKRAGKSKVLFGQNVIPEEIEGTVKVGEALEVIRTKRPPRFA